MIFRYIYRRQTGSLHPYQPAHGEDDAPATRQIHRRRNQQDNPVGGASLGDNNNSNTTATAGDSGQQDDGGGGGGVDRTTSVRSVMTLPVYRPKASENERVLGREGERDGIDVVVEMTTAEEEEALRDEEMELLYRIRATRRRQVAEQEERRRLRERAREANDAVALRELRGQARSRAAENQSEMDELRLEHERLRETIRQRAVSSVSYADVGIARADGTRVRANSADSSGERVGLLSDAASIAADSSLSAHRRDRSVSATLSIDTALTLHDRPDSPGGGGGGGLAGHPHPHNYSGFTTSRIPTPSLRAGSIEAEDAAAAAAAAAAGTEQLDSPPGYEEVSLDEATTPQHHHSRHGSDARAASPYPDPPPEYTPAPSPTATPTPSHSPSASPSPIPGAGPDSGAVSVPGPGPGETRNSELSARMEDLAARAREQGQGRTGGEGQEEQQRGREGGTPRLAGLQMNQVPQIVIEPSSARP